MSAHRPLSTVELRKQNRNRVYRYLIGQWKPVTKQELAFQLSMSLPTLTQNLNELTEMGLIDRSITTDSTGGRRPRLIVPTAQRPVCPGHRADQPGPAHCGHQSAQGDAGQPAGGAALCQRRNLRRRTGRADRTILDNNQLDRDRLLGVAMTLPGIVEHAI